MFAIGDSVINQKIGLPIIGEICGIFTGGFAKTIFGGYSTNFCADHEYLYEWDELYPSWESNFVYLVMSKNDNNDIFWYPQEDLMLFDEDNIG